MLKLGTTFDNIIFNPIRNIANGLCLQILFEFVYWINIMFVEWPMYCSNSWKNEENLWRKTPHFSLPLHVSTPDKQIVEAVCQQNSRSKFPPIRKIKALWRKIPLAPMGDLTPGSAYARTSARPPIDTSGNFQAHMSAELPSNIFPNPSEVIFEVSELHDKSF